MVESPDDRKGKGGRADECLYPGVDKAVMDWRLNILESPSAISTLLGRTRRIAVLGIKTEQQESQPAFYVPAYLARAGFEVIPIPTYYPEVTEILGQRVYRRVADVPGTIDILNIFRRPTDLPDHVSDIIEKSPTAVWMQSGIRNDSVAHTLARNGILVVQDRCLMVWHRNLAAPTT